MAASSMVGERRCRVCGCSEFEPCIVEATGETCAWVEWDLCNFCDEAEAFQRQHPEVVDEPLVEVFSEGDLNAVIAQRRREAGA